MIKQDIFYNIFIVGGENFIQKKSREIKLLITFPIRICNGFEHIFQDRASK